MFKKLLLLPLFVGALVFSACEGPEGPEGLTGPQGPAGSQGPAGQDGNANVKVAAFSFDDTSVQMNDGVATVIKTVNTLTQDIATNGAVLAFLQFSGNSAWMAMPFTAGVDEDSDGWVDYTREIHYEYAPRALAVHFRYGGRSTASVGSGRVKVVMIESSVAGKNASYDFATYEEAARALGLPLD